MKRMLIAAAYLVLVAHYSAFAEEATEAAKSFRSIERRFFDEFNDAADDPARSKVMTKFAKTFWEHAETNPKDGSAVDAILHVLKMSVPGSDANDPGTKALAVVLKDYAKTEQVGKLLRTLKLRGDETSLAVLKSVVDENPSPRLQARACKGLIEVREALAELGRKVKEDAEIRAAVDKARGRSYAKFVAENAAKFETEVKAYEKMMAAKFATVFPTLAVGQSIPEAVSEDLKGKKVSLADLKGKVVVLDFWATWCPPCRALIPHSRKLVQKMDRRPFVFVNVSADDDKDSVIDFMKATPMPWPQWHGVENLVEDWNIDAFPTILVIDHKGVIRAVNPAKQELDDVVEKLVKECEEAKKNDSK